MYYVLVGNNIDDGVANKNEVKFKINDYACDKKADLFMLEHEHLKTKGFDAPLPVGSTIRYEIYKYIIRKQPNYSKSKKVYFYFRPFSVKRIAHSNLLLVVVHNAESSQSNLSVNPVKVKYLTNTNTNHSCNKLNLNSFYRRKLGGCYNSHPEVIYSNY